MLNIDINISVCYNKKMNNEQTNISPKQDKYKSLHHEDEKPLKLKKKAVLMLGAMALAAGAATPYVSEAIANVANGPSFSVENENYVVQPGDTLWTIANQVDGVENVDKRDVISEIKIRNNDDGLASHLTPGSQIEIPKSVE